MENIVNIIKGLGLTRVVALVGSILLMLVLFAVIIFRANQAPMVLLYGGVDAKEAASISERLGAMGVKYEVKPDGTVYVQQDKVGEMRLLIAGEGLVGASTTGYEIFDKNSSFGTTSLVQNINARRALEGELGRTISSMPIVSNARVHLVLPKKKLFSREKIQPTASVTVNIGSRLLGDEQIQSITHLVAASVPNLTPDNVTVVDTRGNLLSSGKRSTANIAGTHAKIRRGVEQEYENSITRMMEKVVGPNKASVKVTAEMNFDRVEENSELYDPEQQVVRSEQRIEDTNSARSNSTNNAVGASSNIPGQEVTGAGSGSEENSARAEETINYEISKTIRKYVREGGVVERLSVAVLVEGKTGIGEDGQEIYIPYPKSDLSKFKTLVETAIGYDEDRGDSVEIIDMAFNVQESGELEEPPLFTKDDYFRIAQYVIMILAIFSLLFFVIRPLLKSAEKAAQAAAARSPVGSAMAAGQPPVAVSGEGVPAPTPEIAAAMAAEGTANESMIDLAKVQGKVKESSVKKVVEIIDQYPEESVGVIRSWMNADSSGNEF